MLINPSFELGNGGNCEWFDDSGVHYDCPQEVRPPFGWTATWHNELGGICSTPTGQPEMLSFGSDPFRIYDGSYSLKYFTFWRCHWGKVWQEIQVAGGAYRASAQVQSWFSGCSDQPYHSGEPLDDQCNPAPWAHLEIRIGIGGTWSQWHEAYNEWALIEVTASVNTGQVMVGVESRSDAPLKHQDVYIDDVRVMRISDD